MGTRSTSSSSFASSRWVVEAGLLADDPARGEDPVRQVLRTLHALGRLDLFLGARCAPNGKGARCWIERV